MNTRKRRNRSNQNKIRMRNAVQKSKEERAKRAEEVKSRNEMFDLLQENGALGNIYVYGFDELTTEQVVGWWFMNGQTNGMRSDLFLRSVDYKNHETKVINFVDTALTNQVINFEKGGIIVYLDELRELIRFQRKAV